MTRPGYLTKKDFDRGVLLIIIGVVGMLISAFADSIGLGSPGFGLEQLSGLVIGSLVTMAGLGRVFFPENRILVHALSAIYVSGILYVGLRPNPCNLAQDQVFVCVSGFDWHDLAINTMGFIPIGYLLMLSFGNLQKDQRANLFKQAAIVAGVGGLISLFLEVSQYYLISGRQSSLFDWIFNTLGTLVGAALYIFIERQNLLGTRMKVFRKPYDPF